MRVLLTGGGGFLGSAIAARLAARGDDVVSFSRGHYPALERLGVAHVRGDLSDPAAVQRAARGCDAAVHTAAKAGVWGPAWAYEEANVVGTNNVLNACGAEGVGRLVYTSTPSVVHAGHDIEGGDRHLPYTTEPKTPYQATKTIAERRVLAANREGLAVVALRPHLIWGPGDPHLVPRIVARARGRRIAIPGDGHNLVDTVYIDNAADAHVAALDALAPGAPCAGQAYFVTNGEPKPIREMILGILRASGIDEPRFVPVPAALAVAAGGAMERVYRALGVEREPPLTRFSAEQLATAHWFDIADTQKDLAWQPAVSIAEGLDRLRAWFDSERTAAT